MSSSVRDSNAIEESGHNNHSDVQSNKSVDTAHRIHQKKQWKLGLSLLSVVVIFWVLSSFLINTIFEDNSYRKPFFITYINTASFTAYLIIPLTKEYFRMKRYNNGKVDYKNLIMNALSTPPEGFVTSPKNTTKNSTKKNKKNNGTVSAHPQVSPKSNDSTESDSLLANRQPQTQEETRYAGISEINAAHGTPNYISTVEEVEMLNEESYPLSLQNTIKLSAQFCLLWFLANFVTNASLSYTSVGSQTILSSTSSFFTLLISYLSRLDRSISYLKITGLIISFVGIVLITKSDIASTLVSKISHPKLLTILFGNFLAILGALLYGVYSTLLKLKVKNVNRINMHVFFGFVGLVTIVVLWPTLIILNYTGYEHFQIPYTKKIWCVILLNLIINFLSDYCWCKAMLLTSPLTVTVGLSTTIPFAMTGDFLFKGKKITAIYLLGALMILLSFFIIDREEKDVINHLEEEDNEDDDDDYGGGDIVTAV
ncbi:hypothetical protein ACO0QE_000720 [Hanseniaspora vineae]